MSVNSLQQRFGDVSFPDVSNTLTRIFPDPARDLMLALFTAAINDELADEWTQATTSTQLQGTDPVASSLPLLPFKRVIDEWKATFPLLALSRTGTAIFDELTLAKEQLTQDWDLQYILAPMTADGVYAHIGALTKIAKLISQVIRQRGHRSYESGALQFGVGKGNLDSLFLKSYTVGQASFADDTSGALYLMCSMSLQSTESDSYLDGAFGDLEGMSIEAAVGDGVELAQGVIYADTNYYAP